jgi:hypothetical protein
MGRLAVILLISACGVQGLSRDVYEHEVAANACAENGDAACAAREQAAAERDRQKLARREYAVPPTPFP